MRISFCIVLLSLSSWLGAQVQFPKTPTKFMAEFKTHVLKTATDTQKVQLQNFENIWMGESLTPFQKKTTMQSIQLLSDKRQSGTTMLQAVNLYSLAQNRNASEKQLDTLALIFKSSFENHKPAEYQFLLRTLESYLAHNILFQDNVVTVEVVGDNWNLSLIDVSNDDYGGGYEFGDSGENGFDSFDEWDDAPEVKEIDFDWDSYNNNTSTQASFDEEETEFKAYAEEMPSLSGGLLKFNNIDLEITTAQDSVVIKGTSGTLSLLNGEFVGSEGTFDWTLAGLDQSIYAKFKDYHFSVKKPSLMAEDVEMFNPEKVDGAISGIFEYEYQRRAKGTFPSYPRFMSYQNKVEIKGLGEDIEYKGGFAMNGSRVFSSCIQKTPSTILVKNEGEVKFKAMAPYFELNDSIINSNPSRLVIYFADKDSIIHPGVKLKYNSKTKEMLVRKDVTIYKNANFTNSYHQLDMDVDQIKWVLSDTIMTMEMVVAKQEVPAYFRSLLQFSETEYVHLKSVYPFHPLQVITYYCSKNRTKEFSVSNIADACKQKPSVVQASIGELQKKGFVTFNQKNSLYSLTDKATHYYLSRLAKKDYDIISVTSLAVTRPKDPSSEPIMSLPNNAVLNLNNNKLTVDGVDFVVLSDSNDVHFIPSDRKVTFDKNRNMIFNGTVTTNNYVFNGREFEFDYDQFNLKLEHIDSIEFTIEVFDSISGKMVREKMDNKLSYSKGTLTIDEADNKSGLKRNPKYPHFDANHGASVLFNKNDILGGSYDTTFRYIIPPFAVDSLSGDMESNVSFEGEFVSGGVFPPIIQKLEVGTDKGFGFEHECPKEGYPVYGGLGQFYGKIAMSKSGLRGEGKIVFLNTTLESMDFVFYKDSVKGLGDIAITKAGTNPKTGPNIKFPACEVTDYEMSWYPNKDSMNITNYDNAFKLFNNEVTLSGSLVITSKGMKGKGLVETNGSLTISKDFLFKDRSFSAKKGQFEILTNVVGKPALRSDYVNVEMDLEKKQAWFSPSEEGYASNNFPYLKYKTSLNDGFWDITKKIVTMEKPYEMKLEDSYFYSTRKSQDSLVFNAEKAYYYIDSLKLAIEGVELIRVADAIVYPFKKKIEIKENAEMSILKNAVLIMDTLNEYHTLIEGEIKINSRKDLDGHASYRYVNFEEDTIPIKFSDFKLEAFKNDKGSIEHHTVARGTILAEDSFFVAPQMMFKGEVSMFAHRRLLSIDGYIRLDLHGSLKSNNWMRYENNSESDLILIDLESQENKNNISLLTGTYFSEQNRDYYSVFLTDKQAQEDKSLFSASGYLTHDAEKREFEVIDKNRIDNKYYSGNLFGYIEKDELYDLQGKFDLINPKPATPHHYSLLFAGHGTNTLIDSALKIKGLGILKFETPPQINDAIGNKFLEMLKYFPPNKTIRLNDTLYHAVGDLAGNTEAIKFKEASAKSYTALNKTSKIFGEGFIINDVKLVWNKDSKAWHSVGPIGLISIDNKDLNVFVKGYLEIVKTPDEDQINFYLESNSNTSYFFKYSENALQIHTTDPELETFIRLKNTEAKNLSKGLYYWSLAEEDELIRFKQHFIQDFLKGKDFNIDYSATSFQNQVPDDEFETQKTEVKDEFEEPLEKTPEIQINPTDEFNTSPKKEEVKIDEFEEEFNSDVAPKEETKKDKKGKNNKSEPKINTEEKQSNLEDEFSSSPKKEEANNNDTKTIEQTSPKDKNKKEKKEKTEDTKPLEIEEDTNSGDEFEESIDESGQ